jgi:predicted component of type VI protein secretion system
MSTCGNCGAKLSCGCQKRTLADGKQGCSNCATKTVAKTVTKTVTSQPTVNTNTWGANRYLNLKKFTK